MEQLNPQPKAPLTIEEVLNAITDGELITVKRDTGLEQPHWFVRLNGGYALSAFGGFRVAAKDEKEALAKGARLLRKELKTLFTRWYALAGMPL